MDIITINLVFNKYIHVHMYDNRERDFLRFNRVLLHVYGKIGPNLESEPFIQEPYSDPPVALREGRSIKCTLYSRIIGMVHIKIGNN